MKLLAVVLSSCVLVACGGGGGSSAPTTSTPTSTLLTVTGTAATGLAIPGATITGKCKVGSGTATTLADGSYALAVTDGQLPCVLQITNPVDGVKLHTVVTGTGSTANANITPLTEMATARVLGSEPNVFFAAFDAAVATQKITANTVQVAQTDIGFVLTGTVETASLGNFISAPLKAATQGSPTSGDAHDKLLDALKLKLSSAQVGALATALAGNQTTDAIKQTVTTMKGGGTLTAVAPLANAGVAQNVLKGATVTLDASTSSAATGKSLTYAWTLTSKPAGSTATLAAPTTAKSTFVADVAGAYVASVIVNDGTSASSASAVTITASVLNAAPVANAGVAQNVVAGTVVTLDGSTSSDANGDLLTYAWTLTAKPAGSTAALSSSILVKPAFVADVPGAYVASLTVSDGKVTSASVTLNVMASAVLDQTPPPTPTNFIVSSAITTIFVTTDGPTYSSGHGHAISKLYGAKWISGALPEFADAALLTEFSGTIGSFASNPASTWHLWTTWTSIDGIESLIPAGGIHGVVTRTGEDVSQLLGAIAGNITGSQSQKFTDMSDLAGSFVQNVLDGTNSTACRDLGRKGGLVNFGGKPANIYTSLDEQSNLRLQVDQFVAGPIPVRYIFLLSRVSGDSASGYQVSASSPYYITGANLRKIGSTFTGILKIQQASCIHTLTF